MNEIEVNTINIKNRKELKYALQTILCENEVNVMQKSEPKRVSGCQIKVL